MKQHVYEGIPHHNCVNTSSPEHVKANVLNQQADLSAIMLFNTDRRFSITE